MYMKIPETTLAKARQITGQDVPTNYCREVLAEAISNIWFEKYGQKAAPQPQPQSKIKPELHAVVDWDQYGMGYDFKDPDFTDIILPWFIEMSGGEKEAEAIIIEKMSGKNPITKPRAWVADLYKKHKKRNDAG